MIDWPLAGTIAGRVAGAGDPQPLPGDLGDVCAEAAGRVVTYAELEPATALPAPESVDRRTWIDINLVSMRAVLDPVAGRLGGPPSGNPLRLAGEVVLTTEAGAVTGYLGRRVLGQYDQALLAEEASPRLLFVAPNIAHAARTLEADRLELLRWIAFHEVTHAVQFAAVPWLRGHLGDMVRELLAAMEQQASAGALLRRPRRSDLQGAVDRVRTGSLVGLVAGPAQKAIIDRLQATMALVEGHAEHVMDAAGAEALPSLGALRAGLEARRAERPPLLRLLEKLLGLELKMRQYAVGKRFCDEVVRAGGVATLNRAWSGPALLPSAAELDAPRAWLARVA